MQAYCVKCRAKKEMKDDWKLIKRFREGYKVQHQNG